MWTLHCSCHEGYRADINIIARQALTNTVCDKLLKAKATRWEEAKAVAASLLEFPLAWRRNTQIQMYWLWKWLESYNNWIFSTWKDKCLFNLIFWIPNSFHTFHYYGRVGTPSLSSQWRHVTDFLSLRILNNLRLPWKTALPWTFSLCWNIFHHSEIWTTCTCPET